MQLLWQLKRVLAQREQVLLQCFQGWGRVPGPEGRLPEQGQQPLETWQGYPLQAQVLLG